MSNKKDAFQLKADFLPVTVLKLSAINQAVLKKNMTAITAKAPQYFADAPIVIDCSDLTQAPGNNDIDQVCTILKDFKMQPIALRSTHHHEHALPVIKPRANKNQVPAHQADMPEKPSTKQSKTITITRPVRAGTQVYAKDADLIVLSSVNAGGEVIADGNIHVYGPLRGRALAGATGDETVSIFSQSLEAELIAIAGHYLVNEKISAPVKKYSMTQVFFDGQQLQINTI